VEDWKVGEALWALNIIRNIVNPKYVMLFPSVSFLFLSLLFLLLLRDSGADGGLSATADVYAYESDITNNDPNDQASFLTCLAGSQQDGIRCSLGGMLSTNKGINPLKALLLKKVPLA